jgi:sensor domain CHASE-containing protein
MSIRTKTILSLFITMVVLTVFLYFALHFIVSRGFAVVENDSANENIERVRASFATEIENLCIKTSDWSTWDDSYKFIEDRNSEYMQSNVAPSSMSGLNLAALVYFDKSSAVATSTGYDPESDQLENVPARIMAEHFAKGSAIARHSKPDSEHSGLLFTEGSSPLIFCSKPILPTSGKGEIRGAIVFARFFDEAVHKNLMRTTKLALAFTEENGNGFKEPIAPILRKLPEPNSRFVDGSDPTTLVGYTRLMDFYGNKSLIARIAMPRHILKQAEASCQYLALSLIVFGFAFIAVTIALVENVVLKRLAKLNADVTRITETFDFSSRVDSKAEDELGKLGLCINRLLAAVAQIQHVRNEGTRSASDDEKGS